MIKAIIAVNNGVVSVVEKPDFLTVEVRSYDIPDDFDPDNTVCDVDDDGNRYQTIPFPSQGGKVIVKLDPMTNTDVPASVTNFYKCEDCDTEWEEEWSCQCDDECPVCGVPYSPYKSEDINQE